MNAYSDFCFQHHKSQRYYRNVLNGWIVWKRVNPKQKVFIFAIKIDAVDIGGRLRFRNNCKLWPSPSNVDREGEGTRGKTLLLLTNVSIFILLAIRNTNFHRNLFRLSISYNAIMRYRSKYWMYIVHGQTNGCNVQCPLQLQYPMVWIIICRRVNCFASNCQFIT